MGQDDDEEDLTQDTHGRNQREQIENEGRRGEAPFRLFEENLLLLLVQYLPGDIPCQQLVEEKVERRVHRDDAQQRHEPERDRDEEEEQEEQELSQHEEYVVPEGDGRFPFDVGVVALLDFGDDHRGEEADDDDGDDDRRQHRHAAADDVEERSGHRLEDEAAENRGHDGVLFRELGQFVLCLGCIGMLGDLGRGVQHIEKFARKLK